MAKNRRKVYDEGPKPCPKCGCCHFETIKTGAKFAVKVCRYCGERIFVSPESY